MDAAWALLVHALDTGAPDLVVVPATTLASLRRDDWPVPAEIERLAGAVKMSQLATRARPYLAAALFALDPVESTRVNTMSVDRHWRCYVSPYFVARTPVEEFAGVWVHEVSHLLRDHARGDRYAKAHDLSGCGERLRMNIAADFEINDDIYGDGLTQPADIVLPKHLHLPEGRLMEDYLGLSASARTPTACPGSTAAAAPTGPPATGTWAPAARTPSPRTSRTPCGSGSPRASSDTPATRRRAGNAGPRRRSTRRSRGATCSVPRSGRRSPDRVPATTTSTAVRPGVPAAVPDVVLPALRRRLPRVSVVIDTSGSVSDAELGSALIEVAAIGKAVGGRRDHVSVLSCDAAAGVAHPLCRAEGIELIGGGGTDLREGFATVLARRPRPDVVVVLTDGQTPWPARPPPCRTVVGGARPGEGHHGAVSSAARRT